VQRRQSRLLESLSRRELALGHLELQSRHIAHVSHVLAQTLDKLGFGSAAFEPRVSEAGE
jgi:hypothetical protein